MMNDLPREKLKDIITQYGRSLANDPQRCEAILRDAYGQYRKEINVLISAMKEGIPTDLSNSQNSIPSDVLLARLTKRLEQHLGLSQEAAKWGVESWAIALGIMQYPVPNPKSIAFDREYYQPRHGSLGENKKRLIIKRFLSLMIDSIVLAIFILIVYLIMTLVNYNINPLIRDKSFLEIIQSLATNRDTKSAISAYVWLAISPILILTYFIVFQSSVDQASWGQQYCKIIVTNLKGTKITAWQALLRTVIAMFFIIYFPIGVFNVYCGLIRRDSRFLHELLSGTKTIEKNG